MVQRRLREATIQRMQSKEQRLLDTLENIEHGSEFTREISEFLQTHDQDMTRCSTAYALGRYTVVGIHRTFVRFSNADERRSCTKSGWKPSIYRFRLVAHGIGIAINNCA